MIDPAQTHPVAPGGPERPVGYRDSVAPNVRLTAGPKALQRDSSSGAVSVFDGKIGGTQFKVMAALALLTALCHAQSKTQPTYRNVYEGDINSRYVFAEASEVALSYAQMAVQGYDDTSVNWEHPAFGDLVAIMRITNAASEAYQCAVKILLPFEQSVDKQVIARGSKFGIMTY